MRGKLKYAFHVCGLNLFLILYIFATRIANKDIDISLVHGNDLKCHQLNSNIVIN